MVGAIIGICTALVAFRQTFAAILDFRFNHLLLPRATSLFHPAPYVLSGGAQNQFYTYQPAGEYLSADLPFTREGGWGHGQEAFVGAPGDATVLGAGAASGAGITVGEMAMGSMGGTGGGGIGIKPSGGGSSGQAEDGHGTLDGGGYHGNGANPGGGSGVGTRHNGVMR